MWNTNYLYTSINHCLQLGEIYVVKMANIEVRLKNERVKSFIAKCVQEESLLRELAARNVICEGKVLYDIYHFEGPIS